MDVTARQWYLRNYMALGLRRGFYGERCLPTRDIPRERMQEIGALCSH